MPSLSGRTDARLQEIVDLDRIGGLIWDLMKVNDESVAVAGSGSGSVSVAVSVAVESPAGRFEETDRMKVPSRTRAKRAVPRVPEREPAKPGIRHDLDRIGAMIWGLMKACG